MLQPKGRRRLVFLGDSSFEFEEASSDGRRGLTIVERGGGLRRMIFLVGAEIKWLAAVF